MLAIKFAITNNFLVIKIAIKMYQGPNNYVILMVYYMCILLLCYKVSDLINKKIVHLVIVQPFDELSNFYCIIYVWMNMVV